MKKVLIIALCRLDYNGISSVIVNYGKTIDKKELIFDILVIGKPNETLVEASKSFCSNIIAVPDKRENPLSYLKELVKVMRHRKYDVVHVHGSSAIMAIELMMAKIYRVPVRIAHSHSSFCEHPFVHKLLSPVFRQAYTKAVACSKMAGDWLYRGRPYLVLQNAIDVELYRFNADTRESYRKEFCLESCLVVGHVGNFVPTKNHEFIVEVFQKMVAQNENVRLVLVGVGPDKKRIENLVAAQNLNSKVLFLERRTDIPQLFQMMDVFILPSKYEGLPMTAIEAQAASLPTILSDTISRQAGPTSLASFIPIESTEEWCDFLLELLRKKSSKRLTEPFIQQLRDNGFDIGKEANRLRQLYLCEPFN